MKTKKVRKKGRKQTTRLNNVNKIEGTVLGRGQDPIMEAAGNKEQQMRGKVGSAFAAATRAR